MKKAMSWVKESMENVTELTIPDEKPVVAVVQCRMYTPLEGTSFCKGMDSSNAAYEQCEGCPLFSSNLSAIDEHGIRAEARESM